MLLTGKRLFLASLALVSLTKLVNACDYSPEFKEQVIKHLAERDFNVRLYFFPIVFFIIANLVLFFVRDKKDYWLPITIVAIGIISAPITLYAVINDECGNSIVTGLRINFFIFMAFLLFQVFLWANGISLQFNKGKIKTVNLG